MAGSPFSLEGRTILIVGATGDVGGALARLVPTLGARTVLAGRDAGKLAALKTEHSESAVLPLDWSSAESRAALIALLPSLDGVVLAGGVDHIKPVRFLTEKEWDSVLSSNLTGPVLLLRDLIKARRLGEGASIVLLSSIMEARALAGNATYAASKAALSAIGRCLALELANRAIRVNSVSAGLMRGVMADRCRSTVGDEAFERHVAAYPLGLGTPGDAASAAAFLLSPAARWITGTSLFVDGGYSLA